MIWLFGIETCIAIYFLVKRWDNPDDRVAASLAVIVLGAATIVSFHDGDYYFHHDYWDDQY